MAAPHDDAVAERPAAVTTHAPPPRALAVEDASLDLAGIVAGLRAARTRWRSAQQRPEEHGHRELPSREVLAAIVDGLRGALFPLRLGPQDLRQESEDYYVGQTLDRVLGSLLQQARLELRYQARLGRAAEDVDARALAIVRAFGAALPRLRALLDTDVLAAFRGDPAARSVDEVLLCYPGVQAMIHHRIAHELYGHGLTLLARLVAERAHAETGIDIHPGATIGEGFFIDHGTGVVIGETAQIGRQVRLYQAVTLGAKRFATEADGSLQRGGARHPIVEDEVVVYAGATILGRITVGRGSVIGGNVWITRDVPAGSRITQALTREAGHDDGIDGAGI